MAAVSPSGDPGAGLAAASPRSAGAASAAEGAAAAAAAAAAGTRQSSREAGQWEPLTPRRLDPRKDRREWLGVRVTMQDTTPANLGYGRDHKSPGHYTSLEAVAAWRLEAPKDGRLSPWSVCDLWRERVRSELRVVKRNRTLGWWRAAADDEFFRLREMRGRREGFVAAAG